METWRLPYEHSKKKAKEIYKSIGAIICPALDGDYVYFTNVGFNHLVRKGRIPRTKNEQMSRFVLLEHVEPILKDPRANIEYRATTEKRVVNRHGEEYFMESTAEFWTFHKRIDDCTIKVVVRKLGTEGDKHFFSIMGDNVVAENLY
ncbi:hypothetical protein A3C89_04000 [Candidatus Kaiserbacteria bacterium RIFCSPHIGHO2_02_FULL_50_50]|uniref:Uncharacterized protein n=1 Tax=Candidatus Kaiserbacteria bacterium RIFCSPHIGHO2_02_FULL_50_50 TaxID=1798492 RepID=A0A1F6DGM3_9BACT|nr:MAG: hypothetical protein A3C89_04000 [Candidatus Kaiserbacteria bacterium RIFCSPHIGHO2_02_FULL_50_50]